MTTDQTTNEYQTDVEVELHELLDWGHDYEAFSDLLREKVSDAIDGGLEIAEFADTDDDFGTMVLVTEYEMTSVPRPNVAMFSVTWEVDA